MLANQSKRPLLQPKPGTFLDPHLGTLGRAAEGDKGRHLRAERQAIVPPVAGRDHPAIKVKNALQLETVERGDDLTIPRVRERGYDTQALLALGAGSCSALIIATSSRSAASAASSSITRISAGSQSSPHGVPYGIKPGL